MTLKSQNEILDGVAHLLLGDLEGLQVVSDDAELLLELDDLGLAGLGALLSALEVGLNHGELAGDLSGKLNVKKCEKCENGRGWVFGREVVMTRFKRG